MNSEEGFLSIKDGIETKIKVKGSSFICFSFPINSVDDAHLTLEKIRKEHYNATHHCYALLLADDTFKYSDDGEPNGTAGIRILNAIQHFKLKNILVIVVRYFGGTKLGTGLLGKTYYESTVDNLAKSNLIEYLKYEKFEIKVDFDEQGSIYKIFSHYNCIIHEAVFSEKLVSIVLVKPKDVIGFKQNLINITKGNIEIISQGSIFHTI